VLIHGFSQLPPRQRDSAPAVRDTPQTTSSRDSGSRSIRNWPTRAASRTPH